MVTLRRFCVGIALLLVVGVVAVAGRAQGNKGGPTPEELLPADALIYARWAGIEAQRPAYQKTALRDVLEDTSLGRFISHIAQEVSRTSGAQVSEPLGEVLKHVWRYGAVASVSLASGPSHEPNLVLVFPGAAARLDQIEKSFRSLLGDKVEEVKQDGRTLHLSPGLGGDRLVWWVEGNHMVFTMGKGGPETILEVATGRRPSLASTPQFREFKTAMKTEPVFQVWGDIDRANALMAANKVADPATLQLLGLDGVKRVSYSVAFEGRALRSELNLDAPAPRRGIPKLLLDQPQVSMVDLPSLPKDTDGFFLLGLDYARTFDDVVAMIRKFPGGPTEADIQQGLDEVSQALEMRLREDLIAALGKKLLVYSEPVRGLPGLGLAFGVEITDQATAKKAVARIVDLIEQSAGGTIQFNRQKIGEVDVAVLGLPDEVPLPIMPTVAVTEHWAVLGLAPVLVQDFVRAEAGESPRWKPANDFVESRGNIAMKGNWIGWNDPRPTMEVILGMAPELVEAITRNVPDLALDASLIPTADQVNRHLFASHTAAVVDDRGMRWVGTSSMPMLSVGSPDSMSVAAVGTALLLPAVQMAREAARRTQDRNNLKQIGLALHNYHDAHNHFPTGTVEAPDLSPEKRLSWMASILPFVEENDVYMKLNLKKPWDDPANDAAKSMLAVFLNPQLSGTTDGNGRGLTHYAGMTGVGEDAAKLPNTDRLAGIFGYDRRVSIRDITDGTANTIMVMDVNDKLGPWARGDSASMRGLSKEPYINGPDGIGGNFPGGANFLFADGSVRFITESVDPKVMRALATKAGGEIVDLK